MNVAITDVASISSSSNFSNFNTLTYGSADLLEWMQSDWLLPACFVFLIWATNYPHQACKSYWKIEIIFSTHCISIALYRIFNATTFFFIQCCFNIVFVWCSSASTSPNNTPLLHYLNYYLLQFVSKDVPYPYAFQHILQLYIYAINKSITRMWSWLMFCSILLLINLC